MNSHLEIRIVRPNELYAVRCFIEHDRLGGQLPAPATRLALSKEDVVHQNPHVRTLSAPSPTGIIASHAWRSGKSSRKATPKGLKYCVSPSHARNVAVYINTNIAVVEDNV